MRPIITLLMVVLLIGGMWLYVDFKNSVVRPPTEVVVDLAQKKTTLLVRRSAPLYDGGGLGGPALTVSIKGLTVLELERTIASDEVVEIDIPNVEIGKNTINVQANFEDPEAFLSEEEPLTLYALEVIVKYGRREQHREVFTSPEPFIVGGDILFKITPSKRLINDGAHAKSPHANSWHAKGAHAETGKTS